MKKTNAGFSTRAIHVGSHPDKETGAVIPPIFVTSTYAQSEPGKHQGYEYSRSHNPTRTRLESCLASLEKAKYCLVTSSGMAAVGLVMHNLKTGSHVLCSNDLYGGTYRLFNTVFNDKHTFSFLDATEKEFIKGITDQKPAMVWIETPSNPLLKIIDIKAVAAACKKVKAVLVVDNTFMSPAFQNPIELGADIVLHSLTKYINGHSDVVGGALMLNSKSTYDKLWVLQNSTGPSLPAFDCWLVLRGVKTLSLRMRTHEENAKKIAKFLVSHPQVEKVIYPGLASHPQHKIAKKQMSGFGGMITFYIKGGIKESRRFLKKLKVFTLAESLGGIESLVDHPAIMTHASIPKKERESTGVTDNLIRLSVGVENIEDLIADLKGAL